jgi:SAM-dependent methyltransferase
LVEEPASSAGYAARLGLDPLASKLVLEVLSEFGVATREGEDYTAAPSLLRTADSFGIDRMSTYTERIPAFLARGERWVEMGSSSELREGFYANVVCALGRYVGDAARELAAILPGSPHRILDVGAGSGVWSFAMAERHAEARVTGMDFANVLPAFEECARQAGLAGRVETLEGDYFSVEIPLARFDRIVLSHVLHLETPRRAAALLRRVAPALSPEGDLVIIENAGGGSAARRRAHAVYRLHRALRTTGPGPHPWPNVRRWLRSSGLTPVKMIPLKSPPYGLTALLARSGGSTAGEGGQRRAT